MGRKENAFTHEGAFSVKDWSLTNVPLYNQFVFIIFTAHTTHIPGAIDKLGRLFFGGGVTLRENDLTEFLDLVIWCHLIKWQILNEYLEELTP